MKQKQNEISKLWSDIKEADKLDPSIIKKIEQVIIEEKPVTRTSERKAKNKRAASRKLATNKSIFGNPMRNVSEELITFYKTNRRCKTIINPVFEKLSYDKKSKKFMKWPILLKDLLINLHGEIMGVEESPKLLNSTESPVKSDKVEGSNQKVVTPSIKVTKVEQILSNPQISKPQIDASHDHEMASNTMTIDQNFRILSTATLEVPKPVKFDLT
jgi:hypothetical protein